MSNVTKKIDKKKQRFHMDVRKNVSVQESLCIELLLIIIDRRGEGPITCSTLRCYKCVTFIYKPC